MNRTARRLLLLAAIGVIGGGISAAAGVPSFTISISSSASTWKSGSDVVVVINRKNTSDQRIFFRKAPGQALGELFMDADVKDEQGNPLPRTKYYQILRNEDGPGSKRQPAEELTSGGSVLKKFLKPGETLQDGIVVSKLFDLSRAGKYTLRVQRRDESRQTLVTSNSIILNITD
jgi:hypothetical protein